MKWVQIMLISLAVILVGAGSYAYYLYNTVKQTAAAVYEPLIRDEHKASRSDVSPSVMTKSVNQQQVATDPSRSISASNASATEATGANHTAFSVADNVSAVKQASNFPPPFNLLFLGVDERTDDIGRSDSIIVVSVNPSRHSIFMFSIPRDTRTEIVGHGTVDKINHAYAFGGVKMSVNTVENFLGVQMDYYVKVNMEGFAHIIDILGGVQVDNTMAFTYEATGFPKGLLSLDGSKALLYSRMRYDDPRGDLGRSERQRKIITELFNRSKKMVNWTKLPEILQQIGTSVKTNFTFNEMMDLNTVYKPQIDHIETDEVRGIDERLNGIYYYSVSPNERARISAKLMEHLKSAS